MLFTTIFNFKFYILNCRYLLGAGLEPASRKGHAPQTCAYANSATPAKRSGTNFFETFVCHSLCNLLLEKRSRKLRLCRNFFLTT